MSQNNFIIQENIGNTSTITDVLKRGVMAIGCFVGCISADQGIMQLSNSSSHTSLLIQRNNSAYVSTQKRDDDWIVNYGNRRTSLGVIVNIPILKIPIVGYTVDVEASYMKKDRQIINVDLNIRGYVKHKLSSDLFDDVYDDSIQLDHKPYSYQTVNADLKDNGYRKHKLDTSIFDEV
jgi:hypothetical protein